MKEDPYVLQTGRPTAEIECLEGEDLPESGMNARVKGMRISVLGAARSGAAVARLLHNHGARVFVSDAGARERLEAAVTELESLNIATETGAHSGKVLDADLLVISPGIPSTIPIVEEARRQGLRIVGELEAASWFCPCPIVAVTGTNGKTTTTALIGRMLEDAKKPHVVAGNIGNAFSSVVDRLSGGQTAVLEVSSFQLDHIESFHPHVSVILNITPDHLDRYGGRIERYVASKLRVFMNQTEDDFLIYNGDDAETSEQIGRMRNLRVRALPFGLSRRGEEGAFLDDGILVTNLGGKRTEVVPAREISIKGVHNLYNAMAAALSARLTGVGVPSLRATLRNFKGVEHRLEFVSELNGVRFVNDSKATNVDSVWYALQAFEEPIVLLLGGRDKGNDYTKLLGPVAAHVRSIVAIGESAGKVYDAFHAVKKVVRAGSMEEAVRQANAAASPGDVVLLSPACASFDWFRDYEDRGRAFKACVAALGTKVRDDSRSA